MKFLKNHILVKQREPETKTAGGIFLPENTLKPSNIGTVTHIGEDVDQDLLGKEIMFHVESSQKFEYEDVKGKIIFPTDIIATLN